jgi:hypothetical protein
MRFYDQVILRAAKEAQALALPTAYNRPTKKETECSLHTKPEGVGLESPLEYIAQLEARHCRQSPQQAGGQEAEPPGNATARSSFFSSGICCYLRLSPKSIASLGGGALRFSCALLYINPLHTQKRSIAS